MLVSRFLERATLTPNKLLFEFCNDNSEVTARYTYGEFESKTRNLAKHLLAYKGQCALLVYPPGLDFILAFVACLRAGVVAVPVYPPRGIKNKDLQMFLNVTASCGAKVALTNSQYNWGTKVLSIKQVLLSPFSSVASSSSTEEERKGAWPEDLKWIVTDTIANSSNSAVLGGVIDTDIVPNQTAFIQYTSGSTSLPKGVVLTHDNLAHNLETICIALRADEQVQVVSWLPMYHDMGLIGSHLGTMYCGGSALMFSPVSFVKNPVMWLELVSLKRATHLQAPNFAYRLTCRKFLAAKKQPKQLDLTSVKHCFNAAEPIDSEAMEEFCAMFERFGFSRQAMVPGYGLAEHTVYVCDGGKHQLVVDRKALESAGRVETCGRQEGGSMCLVGLGAPPPTSQIKILIVDAQTREKLAHGSVGEIWVTSRSKSSQYFGLQDQSQRDLHAKLQKPGSGSSNSGSQSSVQNVGEDLPREPATEEELALEWLRTGDLGFIHGGELFVCGRIKDLIIVRGRNHFPQDLERTAEIAGADKIRPGCVGAFALEEAVVIVAELRSAPTLELTQLCDAIRVAIAKEHGVAAAAICLIKERTIPKTTSGKLSRHRICKAYLDNTLQVVYEWKSSSAASNQEEEKEQQVQPFANLDSAGGAAAVDMSAQEILVQIKREVVSLLELQVADANEVNANIPMPELGFDSMMLTQLKGSIINVFQVEVDDELLYDEQCTLQGVADMVFKKMQSKGQEDDDVASHASKQSAGARSTTASKRKPWIAGFKKGQKCGFCGC